MALSTTFRPLLTGRAAENKNILQRINFKWLLQRIPMFLYAIVSSYGVGKYLMLATPQADKDSILLPIIGIVGGLSFDIGFLGVIALADQQLAKTRKSEILYWMLNITSAVLAALFNTLYHAGGTYNGITPEALTAGIPFAVMGLAFATYYHDVMKTAIDKELAEIARVEQEEKERADYIKANPFVCECTQRFDTRIRRNNHRRTCEVYQELKSNKSE